MCVRVGHHTTTKPEGRQLIVRLSTLVLIPQTVICLAIDFESRHTSVGVYIEPDPPDRFFVGLRLKKVLIVTGQADGFQEFLPIIIRGNALTRRAIDRGTGRVVTGKMRRVDIETDDPTGFRQPDQAPVVSGGSPPPRFPTIHVLAVIVKPTLVEFRLRVGEQSRFIRKKIIATVYRFGSSFCARKVFTVHRKSRQVGLNFH